MTIQKIMQHPGAAEALAAKLIGRVIGQVARGFNNEATADMMAVYKGIYETYPKDTITLPAMFKTMVKRASDEPVTAALDEHLKGLSEEDRALWHDDKSEKDQLLDSMADLTTLFKDTDADLERWDDLEVIAQWSLLNATEAALPGKVKLYASWASGNGSNDNAKRLLTQAEEAIPAVYEIVSEFLKEHADDLADDAERGIAVPERIIEAA